MKHAYQALEPDELTLDIGDVVNVLRKMKDDGKLPRSFFFSCANWLLSNFSQAGISAKGSAMASRVGSQVSHPI